MVVKFEVGKVYFSTYFVWNKANQEVKKKKYWLCVKRNPTGYVSFRQIYSNNTVSGSVDSRKVSTYLHRDSVASEKVSIGYGGSGYWRDHHLILASNEAEGKKYILAPKKKTKKTNDDYGIKGDWRPFEGM